MSYNSNNERFSPFGNINDTSLISQNSIIRSNLFFNRVNRKLGMDLSYLDANQRLLQVNGFDTRVSKEYTLSGRLNLGTYFTSKVKIGNELKISNSDFMENRNFRLTKNMISPELAYQPNMKLRVGATYSFQRNINNTSDLSRNADSEINEFGLNLKYNQPSKSSLQSTLKFIRISFPEDQVNSALGYEVLGQLRPGDNISWNLNWQQRLTSGLQLFFTYEGRRAEDVPVIHIGRIQLSAIF